MSQCGILKTGACHNFLHLSSWSLLSFFAFSARSAFLCFLPFLSFFEACRCTYRSSGDTQRQAGREGEREREGGEQGREGEKGRRVFAACRACACMVLVLVCLPACLPLSGSLSVAVVVVCPSVCEGECAGGARARGQASTDSCHCDPLRCRHGMTCLNTTP